MKCSIERKYIIKLSASFTSEKDNSAFGGCLLLTHIATQNCVSLLKLPLPGLFSVSKRNGKRQWLDITSMHRETLG